MGMQVNTNVAANNAYRNLASTQNDLSKSLEKLSSGLRINRAADDAAGLTISEGLKSQVGGLTVASRNAQDGISVLQTAEGSLNEVQSILQRVRDLAVQAGNDSNNAESRAAIKTEVGELTKELTRIGDSTNFNGTKLLNGGAALTFQIGADGDKGSQISVNLDKANVTAIATQLTGGDLGATGTSFAIGDVSKLTTASLKFSNLKDGVTTSVATSALKDVNGATGDATYAAAFQSVEEFAGALRGDAAFAANFSVSVQTNENGTGNGIVVTALNGGAVGVTAPEGTVVGLAAGASGTALSGGLNFDTAANAQASIEEIDRQITNVSSARAELGASQNRFESVVKTLAVSKENLTAAGSRIRDTDMAEEMVKYTRANILSQAGTAMLAQANQSNSGVLQLLQ
ncbi:flagellin [Cryobacterium sp. TMT1-3]|uniref:flagellin N-terminal helical domain-containing protein n=1 Tax=Cryobacterium sp. TMT1-3 TaxID=1259237 RepID=UPI0010694BF0|nr:flagellin [Cryobacterium sp. TMT1-3]TFC28490.1 flagellin [Cryobacterium sp. TMT1-3]